MRTSSTGRLASVNSARRHRSCARLPAPAEYAHRRSGPAAGGDAMTPVSSLRASAAGVVLALACTAAIAQTAFPSKPIQFIVPYPPGGSNDIFARAIGKRLAETRGKPVIVDNRAGAGGSIGADCAARRPPTATRCARLVVLHDQRGDPDGAAVRPGEELHAGGDGREGADAARRRAPVPAKTPRGALRARQVEARQAQLRLVRPGQHQPLRHRAAQGRGGHRPDARAVQGHGPGGERPDRRSRRRADRERPIDDAARQERQGQGPRRHDAQAFGGGAGTARARRLRRAGLRRGAVVGRPRAGRCTEGGDREAECGDQPDTRHRRDEGVSGAGRCRAGADDARSVRRADPRGHPAVAASRESRRHQPE